MTHETELVATLAAALGLAFVFGYFAIRLGLPALVGYLVAGVIVGPFTPGYVADTGLAAQLAEVGVILLMLGVGMHFSVRDLLAVRRIAIPGALGRMVVITALGALVTRLWAWPWGASLVFGLSLSIASTVVLLRAFDESGTTTTLEGRIAVGWLVVEDLATVLLLVILPAVAGPLGGASQHAGGGGIALTLGITLVKVGAFVALMLFVGTRVVPWLLASVARTGSRELFTLSVLALALGIAFGAATLFGVSFALGAFFAGIVIAESDVSHQAAADALPLQDAFAVLFFVAVGMVFDPRVLMERPLAVLATVLIVTVGKAAVSFAMLVRLRTPLHAALTAAAGLSQIGEFSFILASLGLSLGLLSRAGQSLILAGSILSITLNPLALRSVGPIERWVRARPRLRAWLERDAESEHLASSSGAPSDRLRDHAVIVGFGRVGSTIGRALEAQGIPFLVVEKDRERVEALRRRGLHVLFGDASRAAVLEHAGLERARLLVIAAPGTYQARAILDLAREENPELDTVVRTHSTAEQVHLERQGVGAVVVGERELALGMARYALGAWDADPAEVEHLINRLRANRDTHTEEHAATTTR
ncbi:MAG TPA: cation:proton antiporter [Gemmatimonadaceae bacterium]|nr:cation:proton antiporter [Gemmatimonadaceae bacterium]